MNAVKGIARNISIALFLSACMSEQAARAQSTSGPALNILWTGPQTISLSWTNIAPGFILQAADLLPAQTWQGVLQSPQVLGDQLVVTQIVSGLSANARFF